MAYYNRFRGNYDTEMAHIYERRQAVIDRAKELQPENLDEILASSEDGEYYHKLAWVNVPNPWQPTEGDTILVRPVLACAVGNENPEQEKNKTDKGVWKVELEGRLPTGDIRNLGHIMFFYAEGRPKFEPSIGINTGPNNDDNGLGSYNRWDSADAELLLTLAESALNSQPQ